MRQQGTKDSKDGTEEAEMEEIQRKKYRGKCMANVPR